MLSGRSAQPAAHEHAEPLPLLPPPSLQEQYSPDDTLRPLQWDSNRFQLSLTNTELAEDGTFVDATGAQCDTARLVGSRVGLICVHVVGGWATGRLGVLEHRKVQQAQLSQHGM